MKVPSGAYRMYLRRGAVSVWRIAASSIPTPYTAFRVGIPHNRSPFTPRVPMRLAAPAVSAHQIRRRLTCLLLLLLTGLPLGQARAQPACSHNTGQNATLLFLDPAVHDLGTLTLAPGDRLTLHTATGYCAGSMNWSGDTPASLVAWGDDEMTEDRDGLRPDEPLTLWLYRAATDTYLPLDATFTDLRQARLPEGRYQEDAVLVVQSLRVRPLTNGYAEDGPFPASVVLKPNYPNPFNPTTSIRYGLPEAAEVELAVYDAVGRRVALLVDGRQDAGYHEVTFEAASLPSGLYLYRLRAGSEEHTGTMILLK
ncbi:MAG: T9SS C-terminal target domain-containing protein [Bacteroidetes bacterium]|nr:MAG: T9SS C-terminal target domain-containing protein [Bacteroidota bacterium]